ncbi:hypothetical protein PPERSA_07188 [Pseudocohnilembus persalinus]|uniref:Homeodomain protein n=1 Tax=Pseudocohnilembus persalinus TaxID=266149 RepID=A0A0V0QXY8_PSEPJ|nr:hypothetical protein PPERSA_07188 [Pseudocohnilembus persalinus]|eukprot:KRX07025.1 hypothetical protein PPERSA_07188 [Pseudocohnilembus persalinus]
MFQPPGTPYQFDSNNQTPYQYMPQYQSHPYYPPPNPYYQQQPYQQYQQKYPNNQYYYNNNQQQLQQQYVQKKHQNFGSSNLNTVSHQQQSNGMKQILNRSPIKQVSYFDLLQQSIAFYEQKHTMLAENLAQKSGSSYTLYEDLKLITLLNSKDENKMSSKEIAEEGVINRTQDSIKTRYRNYLKDLREKDFNQIYQYIKQQKTVEGYIVFDKYQDGKKYIKSIQQQDPRFTNYNQTSKNQNQIQQAEGQELDIQLHKQLHGANFNPQNSAMRNISLKRRQIFKIEDDENEEDKEQDIPENQFENEINLNEGEQLENFEQLEKKSTVSKKAKTHKNSDFLQQQQQQQLQNQNQNQVYNKRIQTFQLLDKKQQQDAEELDIVLTVCGNWLRIPKKDLIMYLNQLSGDLNLLNDYLNSADESMLWNEEDDEILIQSIEQLNSEVEKIENKSKQNQENLDELGNENQGQSNQEYKLFSQEIKLFLKYKGAYSVKQRIQYLELVPKFDISVIENLADKSLQEQK